VGWPATAQTSVRRLAVIEFQSKKVDAEMLAILKDMERGNATKASARLKPLQPGVVVLEAVPHSLQDPRAVAERLRSALDLMEAGASLVRHRMRRENPGLSPEDVDAHMLGWLRDRLADSPGRAVSWPHSKS
jgi:hypothetical protein